MKEFRVSGQARLASIKYSRSEKGMEALKEYRISDKGRLAQKKYRDSEKGRETTLRFNLSEKGKECRKESYYKEIREARNSYIVSILCKNNTLDRNDIPDSLIKLKREHLKLKRKLKNANQ